MKLEVLLSTINKNNYEILENMNINSDAVVINQCNHNSQRLIFHDKYRIKWINSCDRGLSKSRNMAIKNSNSDICLIADDDLIYVDDYDEIVKYQFRKYTNADIITFQVEGIEEKFKDYYEGTRVLNFLTLMKVASVEIAFKRDSIVSNNIEFDEDFGAGANYQMGEENIFLNHCLRKGLKIIYVPVKIADLHMGESTWFKGYNNEYFFDKGAQFAALSKKLSIPYILQYIVRKHKLFKDDIDAVSATSLMISGRKYYLRKRSLNNSNG